MAHATMEESTPAANSKLQQSPPVIELKFNEPVESGVGSIEVLDSQSRKATSAKPELSSNGTVLKLKLPELEEGVYTVVYRILSEDGHPVSGSYVFVLGNPPEWKDADTFSNTFQAGSNSGQNNWLMYGLRIIYFAALLLATGVIAWSAWYRRPSAAVTSLFDRLALASTRVLLFAVLLLVFFQAKEMMQGQSFSEWPALFIDTATGRAWSLLIFFALLGFLVLKGNALLRSAWIIVILAIESLIGHPAANNPKLLTIALDFVHLLGSAVWVGGLVALLFIWYTKREEAGKFAASFSQGAFLSLVALILSGIGMTLLFLPKLSYLWLTAWGGLLVVKTALVVLVLITGAWLRMRMKRSAIPDGKLLKVDAALMISIVGIAAVFSYISPLPANAPYNFHEMGEDMHITLNVSPNVPGSDNTFKLQVWMPEETGEPKAVILRLRSSDREDTPIDVPLEPFEDDSYSSFPGFIRTSYQAVGPFIPYAGKWKAELRIMNQEDEELLRETSFQNY